VVRVHRDHERWVVQDGHANRVYYNAEISSHPGRLPSLGEDGWEGAYGHPVLTNAIFEQVVLGDHYNYVPIEYKKHELTKGQAWSDRQEYALMGRLARPGGGFSRAYQTNEEITEAEGSDWADEDLVWEWLPVSRNQEETHK
jgi:hypothetical protein